MVKIISNEDKTLYQCEKCGFRYENKEWALVYFDTYAVIFVRNISENREVIDKFYTPENLNEKINRMLTSDIVIDRILYK